MCDIFISISETMCRMNSGDYTARRGRVLRWRDNGVTQICPMFFVS